MICVEEDLVAASRLHVPATPLLQHQEAVDGTQMTSCSRQGKAEREGRTVVDEADAAATRQNRPSLANLVEVVPRQMSGPRESGLVHWML